MNPRSLLLGYLADMQVALELLKAGARRRQLGDVDEHTAGGIRMLAEALEMAHAIMPKVPDFRGDELILEAADFIAGIGYETSHIELAEQLRQLAGVEPANAP